MHSIKVEPEKITIVGTGYVELRIITDNKAAKSGAYGQPADLVRARTARGIFEIIPYFSNPDIVGIPTGGHDTEELKKLSKQLWKEKSESYAKVREVDSLVISFQEDRIILSRFEIQKITGAGSVTITTKKDSESGPGE